MILLINKGRSIFQVLTHRPHNLLSVPGHLRVKGETTNNEAGTIGMYLDGPSILT